MQTIPPRAHQTGLATVGMHTVVSDLQRQQVTQHDAAADNRKKDETTKKKHS